MSRVEKAKQKEYNKIFVEKYTKKYIYDKVLYRKGAFSWEITVIW